MDDDERAGIKAKSTLVSVADRVSEDARCFITYRSDDARDGVGLIVFNGRDKSAPRLLEYKGRDFIRVNMSDPQRAHAPKLGDLVFVTHTDETLEREANRRIRAAEGTRGEFKGDANERADLVTRLKDHVIRENKPVLVSFDPGAHKLG